jgi:hypothetical protein
MPIAGLQSEPVLCDEPKGCCPLFLMGAVCGGPPECTRRHPQFMRVCIRPPNTHVRPVNQHPNGAPPTQLKSQSWFSTQSVANFGMSQAQPDDSWDMTQSSAAASKRKRSSRSRSSSPEHVGPTVKREKLAPQNLDVDDNCSSDSDVEIVVRSTQLDTSISADWRAGPCTSSHTSTCQVTYDRREGGGEPYASQKEHSFAFTRPSSNSSSTLQWIPYKARRLHATPIFPTTSWRLLLSASRVPFRCFSASDATVPEDEARERACLEPQYVQACQGPVRGCHGRGIQCRVWHGCRQPGRMAKAVQACTESSYSR